MRLIHYIDQHSNKRTIIILLTFTLIGALLIFSQYFGITPLADEKALDPLYYYDSTKFYEILHSLSVNDRTSYKLIHLADYIFMFGFYPLITFGLSFVLKGMVNFRFVILLPLLSLFCDFFENLIMDLHLYFYPSEIHILGGIAGYLTALKFGSLFLSVIIFIIFFIVKTFKTDKE